MAKIFLIKNNDYQDKKVVAKNMKEALIKYEEYLSQNFIHNFPCDVVFEHITSCEYVGEYVEDDFIK